MEILHLGGWPIFMGKKPEEMHVDQRRMFNIIKNIQNEFEPEEAQKVLNHLSIFNSLEGAEAISDVFLRARKKEVPLAKILEVFGEECDKNWCEQVSLVRGDPGAARDIGKKNRKSLYNMCKAFGIPLPKFAKTSKIPSGPFVVESVHGRFYRFGREDKKGCRLMRHSGLYSGEQGSYVKVLKLIIGEDMVVHYDDYGYTSFKVLSIIEQAS